MSPRVSQPLVVIIIISKLLPSRALALDLCWYVSLALCPTIPISNLPLISEVDSTFPAQNLYRAVDILTEEKKQYHVQVYSGTVHGFTTRANLSNENSGTYLSLR